MKPTERLKYHFEPIKGWINDPNGLVYYKGEYHIFAQHNPYAPKWGQMHWLHATSKDLIHWQQLSIALYPDMPYEDKGGCYSGSAIVKDDRLYLFYTSVSKVLGQTQSMAYSDDGITFHKYEGNPMIRRNPVGTKNNFRDPKVEYINNTYYMVTGSDSKGIPKGKVLLFRSDDLINWEYVNTIYESRRYIPCIECPDLFELGSRFSLMFSRMGLPRNSTRFIPGDFNGKEFIHEEEQIIETGPDFYAPQTFNDDKGRRIMIGWLWHWGKRNRKGSAYAGALTVPRVLEIRNNKICNFPIEETKDLLTTEDELVKVNGNTIELFTKTRKLIKLKTDRIDDVHILKDTHTIEVFINKGEYSATYWFE